MGVNKRAALLQRSQQAKKNDVPVKNQSNPINELDEFNTEEQNIKEPDFLDNITNPIETPTMSSVAELTNQKNDLDVHIVQDNENVSCETTKCTIPSLPDITTQNVSTEQTRRTINDYNVSIQECSSWGTSVKLDSYTAIEFYLTKTSWKKFQLINNIIKSDMDWVKSHPEFPSMDFVMEQIQMKSKKNKNEDTRINTTFTLTKDSLEHIKIMSKRCSMTMYEYVEYLIKQYI